MTSPSSRAEGWRTVSVKPLRPSEEAAGALKLAVAVALISVVLSGIRRGNAETDAALAPYQVLFLDQPPESQRLYRELVAGLEDALRMRKPSGEWPGVKELSAEFVPPFSGARPWEFRRKGDLLNYVSLPSAGSREPAFLLLLQENVPHAGFVLLDEFHRKLDDGALIHVGIWFHPQPRPASDVLWMPEREGWKEIVLGSNRAGGMRE